MQILRRKVMEGEDCTSNAARRILLSIWNTCSKIKRPFDKREKETAETKKNVYILLRIKFEPHATFGIPERMM